MLLPLLAGPQAAELYSQTGPQGYNCYIPPTQGSGGNLLGSAPDASGILPWGFYMVFANMQGEPLVSPSTTAESQQHDPLQGLVLNPQPGSPACQVAVEQSEIFKLYSAPLPGGDNSITGERAAEFDCSLKGAV